MVTHDWGYVTIFFLHRKVRLERCFCYNITESFVSIGWKIFQNGVSFIEPLWRWEAFCVLCHVSSYMAAQWPEVLLSCYSLPLSDLAVLSVPISRCTNVEHYAHFTKTWSRECDLWKSKYRVCHVCSCNRMMQVVDINVNVNFKFMIVTMFNKILLYSLQQRCPNVTAWLAKENYLCTSSPEAHQLSKSPNHRNHHYQNPKCLVDWHIA